MLSKQARMKAKKEKENDKGSIDHEVDMDGRKKPSRKVRQGSKNAKVQKTVGGARNEVRAQHHQVQHDGKLDKGQSHDPMKEVQQKVDLQDWET